MTGLFKQHPSFYEAVLIHITGETHCALWWRVPLLSSCFSLLLYKCHLNGKPVCWQAFESITFITIINIRSETKMITEWISYVLKHSGTTQNISRSSSWQNRNPANITVKKTLQLMRLDSTRPSDTLFVDSLIFFHRDVLCKLLWTISVGNYW